MSRESLISENDWQGFLMSVQRSLREEQGEEEKEGSTWQNFSVATIERDVSKSKNKQLYERYASLSSL
jgi:hypothetical protein